MIRKVDSEQDGIPSNTKISKDNISQVKCKGDRRKTEGLRTTPWGTQRLSAVRKELVNGFEKKQS